MIPSAAGRPTPGRETERKFLVLTPDAVPLTAGARREALVQGYLNAVGGPGGAEIRIRRHGEIDRGACFLTVKSSGGGLERVEVELPITPDQFALLWPLTEGRRVEKTRHRVPWEDGLTLEVDVYRGALAGLVIVEVEFPDPVAAGRFQAPVWCGREVTEDPAYRNAALARHGRPSG